MNLLEKFRETALSVLPVMGLVLALGLLAVPAGAGGPWWLGRFLVGGALLVLGLTVFLLGVDLGIRPMGERCGAALTAKRSLALLLGAAFVVGLVVTAAEPDIQVFGDQVRGVFPAVRKGALTFSIAGGVGLFMALGMLRTTLGIPLKAVLAASYAALFLLAAFAPAPFVGVAFDSGGATTGPMTVPFILALGIGVAAVRARGDRDGGFGLTGVASVGPVAAVLVYSLLNANVAAPHAESAECLDSHAENAETAETDSREESAEFFDSHAESAETAETDSREESAEFFDSHAESAENAELSGGASSPSEPSLADGTTRAKSAKKTEKDIRRQLRRIVVGSVDWQDAEIDDVIRDLCKFSRICDSDDPLNSGGIGFSVFLGDIEDRDGTDLFGPGSLNARAGILPISIRATDIRLASLLDRIESKTGFAWRIEDGRVVLSRERKTSTSRLSSWAGRLKNGVLGLFRRRGLFDKDDSSWGFVESWEDSLPVLTADLFRQELAKGDVREVLVQNGQDSAAINASNALARQLFDAIAAADDVPPPADLVASFPAVSFAMRKDDPASGIDCDGDNDGVSHIDIVRFSNGRSSSNPDDQFFWENPGCDTVVRVRGIAPLLEEAEIAARQRETFVRETVCKVVLDAVDIRDASLPEILGFLERSTKGFAGEDGAAIPFSFDEKAWWGGVPDDDDLPRLTIRSESISLMNLLALVSDMAGVRWRIADGGIRCIPRRFEDGVSIVASPAPVPRPRTAAAPEPIQHSAFGIQHSSFFSSFAEAFPEALRESLSSIAPLFGLFLVFQFALLKMTLRQALRISIGFVWALIGLSVFLTGVNGGFMQAGRILGAALGGAAAAGGFGPWALLVGTGLAFGAVIVCAEPAVWVLSEQVEEASGGAIRRRTLLFFLSLGTALAIGLAMWRAVAGFPLWRLLLPGYALALLLLARTPQPFAGIAFDSGGVASGPLTSTFVLSFTLGAASAGGGGSDSFGVIALVAMMPLAAIQLMGILVDRKRRRAGAAAGGGAPAPRPAAPAPDPATKGETP